MKNEVRKVLITYQSVDLVDLISLRKNSPLFSGTFAFEWNSNSYFTWQFDDVTLVKKTSAVLVSRVKINCILHLNVNEGLWRPLQAEENLFIIVAFIHTDKKCSSVVANIPKIIFATPRCLKMTQIVLVFELFVLLKLPCLVILLLTTSRKIDHAF